MPKKGKEERGGGSGNVSSCVGTTPSVPTNWPGPDGGTGLLSIQGQPDSDPKRQKHRKSAKLVWFGLSGYHKRAHCNFHHFCLIWKRHNRYSLKVFKYFGIWQ